MVSFLLSLLGIYLRVYQGFIHRANIRRGKNLSRGRGEYPYPEIIPRQTVLSLYAFQLFDAVHPAAPGRADAFGHSIG